MGGLAWLSSLGMRMTGEGICAEQIGQLFRHGRERVGLAEHGPRLAAEYFRPRTRPGEQMSLF